jgi:hypothetical protein
VAYVPKSGKWVGNVFKKIRNCKTYSGIAFQDYIYVKVDEATMVY